jgi:hypothetical protein
VRFPNQKWIEFRIPCPEISEQYVRRCDISRGGAEACAGRLRAAALHRAPSRGADSGAQGQAQGDGLTPPGVRKATGRQFLFALSLLYAV